MAIEKIALDNVAKVFDNDNTVVTVDPITAVAYEESVEAAEHVAEVEAELEDKAEDVILDAPEAPEVKQDTIYTKKLVLDESIEEFDPRTLSDKSDEDDYLDYDMFDFVYGIVTDDWPKPKNPLDHPIRKFQHMGGDDYINTNENKGVPQVSVDLNGNIVVYADTPSAFDDVRAVCEHYHIECEDPTPRRSGASRWPFSMRIHVPTTSEGYPMMMEDFFAPYGLSISDVIEDHKVGGGKIANWGKTYNDKVTKDIEGAEKLANDHAVEDIYQKHVTIAARSSDPLEGFLKDLYAELNSKNLDYSKSKIKKRFFDEFNDDFEDEE